MSPVAPFPDLDAVREEASTWIARAYRGLTEAERIELREWSRRPVNRRAMNEMSDVWQGLGVLSVLSDLFPLDGAQPVVVAPPSRTRWIAVAASVVVVLAGAVTWLSLRSPAARVAVTAEHALQAVAYSSAMGEHRTIPLPDGSVLALNSDTVLEVALSPTLRSLVLHRGEAHFTVAHDANRPFLVAVNGRTVRAVGTAFNVRRRGDAAVEVLVDEGVVRAYQNETDPGSSVEAGHLLRIDEDGVPLLRRVDRGEMDRLLAWRRGELILDGITLEAAMAELSRYTTRRIRIDDPKLRALRLGGSFPTNDLAAVLRTLRANFNIEASEDGSGTLTLRQVSDGAGAG